MEFGLKSLFGLHLHSCTHWLRPRNHPLPPAFGLMYEGAIGQPRYTASFSDPLVYIFNSICGKSGDTSMLDWLKRRKKEESLNHVLWQRDFTTVFLHEYMYSSKKIHSAF